jgi:hypothetical protein
MLVLEQVLAVQRNLKLVKGPVGQTPIHGRVATDVSFLKAIHIAQPNIEIEFGCYIKRRRGLLPSNSSSLIFSSSVLILSISV